MIVLLVIQALVAGLTADTAAKLAEAERMYGEPFHITSGFRTPEQNRRVGGVSNSYHLRGMAVDIAAPESVEDRQRMIACLIGAGFTGIGVYKTHIHADTRPIATRWIAFLRAKTNLC